MTRALVNVPAKAKRGEIIEIKTLVSHPMETGYRSRTMRQACSRATSSRRSTCTYNGEEMFRAELFPAMSANPFLTFSTVATESGDIAFTWTGDNGFQQPRVTITVE